MHYPCRTRTSNYEVAEHAVALELLATKRLLLQVADKVQHLLGLCDTCVAKPFNLAVGLFHQRQTPLLRVFNVTE